MIRKRPLAPALSCGRYESMGMLHDNHSWPCVGDTSMYQQLHQHRNLHHDHRQFYSFWPWRGGSSEGTDDYVDDDGFTESPQVSSFLLGSASRKEDKNSSQGSSPSSSSPSSSSCPVSVCTAQGHRSYMEDEYFVSNDGDFAACFDGHGGRSVSKYLRKNLYANVQAFLGKQMGDGTSDTTADSSSVVDDQSSTKTIHQPTVDDYASSLEYALDKCDREVERISHWSFQGSTAIVVWIHEGPTGDDETSNDGSSSSSASSSNEEGSIGKAAATPELSSVGLSQRTILAANVGDSRAVLCRNSTGWELSKDHKPNDPRERERIERSGGQVIWCGETDDYGIPIEHRGVYRVNGNLALARAVGDRSEKPAVTAEPDIISVPVLDGEDLFILLATDGLWDVMDSQEAVSFILSLRDAKLSRKRIATQVVEEALRRRSFDNVTVVIIWLDGRTTK
eukprot:CAMPEP_0113515094 /NCGR_PEP_ID=MMETSP0014_2-20120614/40757_1 /TAXON_ID=2857 /ORGANISM="Nitzschia sp." /LENGTH=450 /DNA_ID=CAMNT_0000411631 /DNA_START=248 /DNA_END=1600 /DNA_ORIENTATION=+ /assembly_acc=CAM_ASM_000159